MDVERKVHMAAGKARKSGFSDEQVQSLLGLMEAVFAYQIEKSWGENQSARKQEA